MNKNKKLHSNFSIQEFLKILKCFLLLITIFIGNLVAQDDIIISDLVFGKVEVSAPNSITLNAGFHAVLGCDFLAYIGPNQGYMQSYTMPAEQTVSSVPNTDKNYIKSITLREEKDVIPTTAYEHLENIQYYDGLGRSRQSIDVHASPGGNDIIQLIVYDKFGRESNKYLPYASSGNGEYRSYAPSKALEYYTSGYVPEGRISDNDAKINVTFDGSPLNRVIEEAGPGYFWTYNDKHLTYNYTTNAATVANWRVNNNGSFSANNYPKDSLYVIETIDENGNAIREYKDKQGNVVQKASKFGGGWKKTLYIYDDLQRLRCVVPPKATSPDDADLCYYYSYDKRGRMIMKSLPGAEPVYMVYDKRDNLVLTQDGEARGENPDLYYFTKYDPFNRPVMTGNIYIDDDISTIRDNFEDFSGQPCVTYDVNETPYGYSLEDGYPSGYTIDENDVLAVNYYDNYDYVNDLLDENYECSTYDETHNSIDFNLDESDKTQGLVTGSMTKVLPVLGSGYIPADSILYTLNYYDDYGNVIRSVSDNHMGGKDIISTNYKPITYEVENTLHLHTGIGDDLRILMGFDYDHTGRLIETTHQINSEEEVVISELKYNEIGDLITKYLHSEDEGSTKDFLQKTDYVYNIRGWLKSINDLSIDVNNDAFGMELYYENVGGINNLVSNGSYNGNISGVKWRIKNDMTRGYGYEYDDLNRLTYANYGDGGNLDQHEDYYSMSVPAYDENGNILKLKRYFNNTLVDDLTYNYYVAINQLQSVTDNGTASSQVDDYPGTSGTYTYDDNGNMDHDGGKNLDIEYNYLNLPEVIDFGGDNKLFYHYDAAGRKLAKYKDVSMGTDEVTHYIGEIVYSGNNIDYILMEEGRIVPYESEDGTRWLYEYYMKDHLGNTRAVFNGTDLGGNIDMLQHSNYYPFGLAFDLVDYNTSTTSDYKENKYLYNNKELQDDMMESKKLDWYDYGARMYDPQLGRWHVIDPMAEKYNSWSQYNYAANNPILFIDPNGDTLKVNSANASATAAYNQINKDAMGGFYETSLDANGNVAITATGKKGTMTDEQKKYHETLSTVVNSVVTTSINVVENDNNVIVGDVSTSTIDVGDMNAIDQNNQVVKAENFMAHEVWEQFNIAYGVSVNKAHESGSNKEGYIGNYTRDPVKGAVIQPDVTRPGAGNEKLIIQVDRTGKRSVYIIDLTNKNVTNVIKRENP